MQLNARQFETLERIVAVPSAYTQMKPVGDEIAVQELIWEMLKESSCCRGLSKQIISNQSRFNIIAEKGAPIEEAEYVVMVYVHTDTIKKKKDWTSDYKLVRDGSVLRGIGAYDMKAGVMLLIDLLQTMDLPPGVTLVGAFCVGEERDSDGITTLMQWPHIKRVKLVLSPEIGTMGNDAQGEIRESDSPKDVIIGRPGNVKSSLVVTTGESHAFNVEVPDANDAWCCLRDHLKQGLMENFGG